MQLTNKSASQQISFRRAGHDEVPILLAIANEAYANSYEFTPFTEEDLRLNEPDHITLVAQRGDKVIGFALIDSHSHRDEAEAEIESLAVTKQAGTSVEKLLVYACEKTAKAKFVTYYLPPEDEKIGWLTKRGYVIESGYCHFVASLDQLPPPPTVEADVKGFRERSMTDSEEDEIINVVNAAYGHERLTKQHFERWRKQDPLFSNEWVLLGVLEDKIVSVVCSRQDIGYNQTHGKRRGYLGPAGTLPEFRSRGLNKALNWHAMKFLRDKGMSEVSLYTAETNEQVHRLAKDLGYQQRYVWKRLKKTLG
jgi:ribosomal protein S18 acetylase RimI-like enzyme